MAQCSSPTAKDGPEGLIRSYMKDAATRSSDQVFDLPIFDSFQCHITRLSLRDEEHSQNQRLYWLSSSSYRFSRAA